MSKQKSNNITWISIKCPRQTNNIDCGYYVLRFMKEIVEKNKTIIPETVRYLHYMIFIYKLSIYLILT